MGSGGGNQNTVTQVQQIPQFEQQFAMENQNLARSLADQPYPQYQGSLIAPWSANQNVGAGIIGATGGSYQPYLDAANQQTQSALAGIPNYVNYGLGSQQAAVNQAGFTQGQLANTNNLLTGDISNTGNNLGNINRGIATLGGNQAQRIQGLDQGIGNYLGSQGQNVQNINQGIVGTTRALSPYITGVNQNIGGALGTDTSNIQGINQGIGGVMGAVAPTVGGINQGISGVIGGEQPQIGGINQGIGNVYGNTVGNVNAYNPANSSTLSQFMNPYVQQALAPQLQAAQLNLAQQQNQLNAGATQAGAFGDARLGAQSALANAFGNNLMSGIEAQGYNTAFQNAQNTMLGQQNMQANLGQMGLGALAQQAGNTFNLGNQQLGALGQQAGNTFNLGQMGLGALQNQAGNQLNLTGQQLAGFGQQAGNALNLSNAQLSALQNRASNVFNQGQQQLAGFGQQGSNILNLGQQQLAGLGQRASNNLNLSGQALQALGQQGQNQLAGGQLATNAQLAGLQAGNMGLQGAQLGMGGAQQLAGLGQQAQGLGLNWGGDVFALGSQEQQQQQQALNTAYQQYQNQVQWPMQMLNTRLSALSLSPYNMTNQTTLPQANMAATNLGTFATLAGGLGSLLGPKAPVGGQAV